MLARRLIPCLDVAGGRVVKGVHFRELRDAGDPVDQAARYDAAGADEVVLLDIGASHEERGTLIDLVSRVADRLFVPFTVGGGIRSVADARQVLRAGADKVAVSTAATSPSRGPSRARSGFPSSRPGGPEPSSTWPRRSTPAPMACSPPPCSTIAACRSPRLAPTWRAGAIRSAREPVLSPHLPRGPQYPEGSRGDLRCSGAPCGTPGRGTHRRVGALRAPRRE